MNLGFDEQSTMAKQCQKSHRKGLNRKNYLRSHQPNTLIMHFYTPLAILFLAAMQPIKAQINDNHYRIYGAKEGKEVTLADIATAMEQADVLFFGEEHNDSVAHHLELKMFELMAECYGTRAVLSMEMFDRDVQLVMNEYLSGKIKEKHLKKDARVWNNYRDYRPMVELAREKELHVICANAPTRYTNLAGREGQAALKSVPAESKKFFAPLPYATASGGYLDKLNNLMGHDSGAPAMSGGFDLVTGQSLWDATMAWSIAEYAKKNKGKKIFQVNGRFHSDEHFAIVTQLKKYAPKLKPLVISCGPLETFSNPDWSKLKHLGDYVIITDPAVPKTYE